MKPAFWSSLVLATTLVACGGDSEPGPAPAQSATSGETIQVTLESLASALPVDGTVRAREQASLSTRMMARITSVEAEVGDHVDAGQVLVRLGTDDIAANRASAEAAVRVAEAARDEAARQVARMDTLYAQDAVPLVQRDQTRLALVQAESQLAMAEAAMQEVDAASRYAALRAPFSGTVVSRTAAVGDLAAPGMPLMGVAADGPREVLLGVPPEVARTLSPGDEITVQNGSAGKTVAKVRAIASGADPRTRTVEVRADLPADWPTGVSVTGLVPDGTHEAIAIPESAIVRRGQLTGVRVVTDEGESLRWIRLGRRLEAGEDGEARYEVLSGLEPGERIGL
ncbi:MAG: efflux RND transporter periplasmic adaptor subunit [Gemmatimonadota bacterium]|jgi:RND family efflux transporter MFP subunit